jgi:hypothetical protein
MSLDSVKRRTRIRWRTTTLSDIAKIGAEGSNPLGRATSEQNWAPRRAAAPAGGNKPFEDGLAADNANFGVIHFDLIDDRPEIGASEGSIACQEICPHHIHESQYFVVGDAAAGICLGKGAVESSLSYVPLSVNSSDAAFERSISQIRKPIFDRRVEPPEATTASRTLTRSAVKVPRMIFVSRGLPLHQACKEIADARLRP